MGDANVARVLDVGNCDPDHSSIRLMLTTHFRVEVDRVMFVDDALSRMRQKSYDLVLFNRLIFADGSDGMELLRGARREPDLADIPIMMVSNFAEAQAMSVAAGGIPGFGKAAINQPSTLDLLSAYLPRNGCRD